MNAIVQTESLVPVIEHDIDGELQPCVDARTLHGWLGSKQQFADWIKSRIKTYKFDENVDFVCLSEIYETQTRTGKKGRATRKQFFLTLDMAKELSMVESNDQGKMARRYFINCEKALRQASQSIQLEINKAMLKIEHVTDILSNAGRTLNVLGKQTKPQLMQNLDALVAKAQPTLPFND